MYGEIEKMKKGKTADLKVKNWIWKLLNLKHCAEDQYYAT
jgi:hypothetical protein